MSGNYSLSVVVVSPNTPYRSALVEMLQKYQGVRVEGHGPCAAEVIKGNPGSQPAVVFIDGRAIDSVLVIRKTWPDSRILCLLDYLSEWEAAILSGADACILKERGISTLIWHILSQLQPTGSSS